jgi:glycerol-3-phosphate dehydrogenase
MAASTKHSSDNTSLNASNAASARKTALAGASGGVFDLLVIGGGITGAGIARDAALRGIKVALIERHDFAFGTSSRTSRLLHGGIRYLAQGKIRLVREASVEKTILHRIAPHLAEPLPFIFPAYREASDWPFWQLRIGVKIYDLLCGGKNLGRSGTLSSAEVARRIPQLNCNGLLGAARYFDGFTQDARLTLDTLRSAEAAGARLLNYAQFEKAEEFTDGFKARIFDVEGSRTFMIESRAIVNATGPWSEELPGSKVQLRLTKGIHLVFARNKLPIEEAIVITEGARVLFLIPWGERLIVGTTDTDYSGAPENARSEPADVDYLLKAVQSHFPGAVLGKEDIVSSWAGVRPLIADSRRGPSDISRSHQIRQSHPRWWDVAGGKLTTYRLIAEQTVDEVAALLGKKEAPCVTSRQELLPAEKTRGISQIVPPPFSSALVEHFCAHEWARHLDDVMIRRSGWHHYDGGERSLECAECMAEFLRWIKDEIEREMVRSREAWDMSHYPARLAGRE